jgi:hypothetical protein
MHLVRAQSVDRWWISLSHGLKMFTQQIKSPPESSVGVCYLDIEDICERIYM